MELILKYSSVLIGAIIAAMGLIYSKDYPVKPKALIISLTLLLAAIATGITYNEFDQRQQDAEAQEQRIVEESIRLQESIAQQKLIQKEIQHTRNTALAILDSSSESLRANFRLLREMNNIEARLGNHRKIMHQLDTSIQKGYALAYRSEIMLRNLDTTVHEFERVTSRNLSRSATAFSEISVDAVLIWDSARQHFPELTEKIHEKDSAKWEREREFDELHGLTQSSKIAPRDPFGYMRPGGPVGRPYKSMYIWRECNLGQDDSTMLDSLCVVRNYLLDPGTPLDKNLHEAYGDTEVAYDALSSNVLHISYFPQENQIVQTIEKAPGNIWANNDPLLTYEDLVDGHANYYIGIVTNDLQHRAAEISIAFRNKMGQTNGFWLEEDKVRFIEYTGTKYSHFGHYGLFYVSIWKIPSGQ